MALSDPIYLIFLAAVVFGIRFVPEGRFRLSVLTCLSLLFYMSFAPWYALILLVVVGIAYCGGIGLARLEFGARRTAVFTVVLAAIFLPLFVFKYLASLWGLASPSLHVGSSFFDDIVLPVGISFYTFQAAGYLIDVQLENVAVEGDFVRFASFLCFFPIMSAGPIERGAHLLPQLSNVGGFDYARSVAGLRAILVGLMLKVVVADSLAPLVDRVYSDPAAYGSIDLCLATVYFAFQVYADFAGYTLIAIGSARLLGIELLPNFAQPYLSQTLSEFWRNWHITMSSWFRDYVFTPLQFYWRRGGTIGMAAALTITFLLVGLWHGAGWKFVVFGIAHGVLVSMSVVTLRARNDVWKRIGAPSSAVFIWRAFMTFTLAISTFVLFRANSLHDAIEIYKRILFGDVKKAVTLPLTWPIALIVGLLVYDLSLRFKWPSRLATSIGYRWGAYYVATSCIIVVFCFRLLTGSLEAPQFLYFKF